MCVSPQGFPTRQSPARSGCPPLSPICSSGFPAQMGVGTSPEPGLCGHVENPRLGAIAVLGFSVTSSPRECHPAAALARWGGSFRQENSLTNFVETNQVL
jgi:hypothetical protein